MSGFRVERAEITPAGIVLSFGRGIEGLLSFEAAFLGVKSTDGFARLAELVQKNLREEATDLVIQKTGSASAEPINLEGDL